MSETPNPGILVRGVIRKLEPGLPAEPLALLRTCDGARTVALATRELAQSLDLVAVKERLLEILLAVFPGCLQAELVLDDARDGGLTSARHKRAPATGLSPAFLREAIDAGTAMLGEEGPGGAAAFRRVMAAPLVTRDGTVLGGVQLASEALADRFEEPDLDLLVCLAATGAAVLSLALDHRDAMLAQRSRYEQDFAQRVQRSFLPQGVPLVPGYSLHHHVVAAEDVGGDYYDFIPRKDGGWVVVVADITGKGLPAALYMARLSAEVRAQVAAEPSLATVMARLNETFRQLRKEVMYVTCALVALQPEEHRVEISLAGHPPPILLREGRVDPAFGESLGGGLPLGLFGEGELLSPYTSTALELAPGDLLLLYTDGLIAATNPQDEEYGTERVAESLVKATGDLRSISRHLLGGLDGFRAGRPFGDDTTLVLLQRDR